MENLPPGINRSILEVHTLDEFLEGFLSNLLQADHVRKVQVHLFNKRKDLVPVAEGSEIREGGIGGIKVQSWLLDSSIRHTTRRPALPAVFPHFTIPLAVSGELLGFLQIQIDQIPAKGLSPSDKFHSVGLLLAFKIKEMLLEKEIAALRDELQKVIAYNRENVKNLCLLSKELYAVTAISTKINQSLDFRTSLKKSLTKVREVFNAGAVALFLKNRATSGLEMAEAVGSSDPERALVTGVKKDFVRKIMASGIPLSSQTASKNLRDGRSMSLLGVPLKSKTCLGSLVLLHDNPEGLGRDDLRLLSGLANILAMAVENLGLYEEAQGQRRQSAFLLDSIAEFNKRLDLERTLISVAEKGAELIGEGSLIYLLSETRFPMIQVLYRKESLRRTPHAESFNKIEPPELKSLYREVSMGSKPLLIKSVKRSKKLNFPMLRFLQEKGIHSLMAVPLSLRGRRMGLLIMGRWEGARVFTLDDLSLAGALAGAASAAIQNARAHTASLEMSDFLEEKIREKSYEVDQITQIHQSEAEDRKDIVFRVNRRNRFVFVNKAMERVSGCSKEELYRGDIRAEDVICEEDRGRIKECLRRVLSGELAIVRELEYRHLNRNGEDHIISLTVYPETDRGGCICGFEGVGHDMTDQRRLEAELAKAKDLALLGEFSGAVAHQLRNPLGEILMGAKLLENALGLGKSIGGGRRRSQATAPFEGEAECLSTMFHSLSQGIHNLDRVVTELLDYTKTLKLSRSTQKIEVILDEVLQIFEGEMERRKIEAYSFFNPYIPPLSVDSVLLGQAFQNVVQNAIQAMPDGGTLYITGDFSVQRPGFLVLSFSDTGGGIQSSDLDKIFHPLYTTKDSGTGLGLSLAYRITEAHGGTISACLNPCPHLKEMTTVFGRRTPPSRGVTIHVLLPVDAQPQPILSGAREVRWTRM